MANRQTFRYLADRFERAGIRPLTRFGQNFLVDLNLIDLIARSAELSGRDVVLEVGAGMGSLTTRLADRAGHVVSVEIDRNLAALAAQEVGERSNFTLLQQDALRNKNQIDPRVLEAVRDALARPGAGDFKLVANLPYNIATPIISNLLAQPPVPDLMVVTIQKELADRILARPGSKDYGALSVWVQTLCDAEIVRLLPPSVFWPRPKVTSAILKIRHRPERRAAIADLDFFHRTVRALFFHRRKFIRSVVTSAMKTQLDKAEVDRVLAAQGIADRVRAEQLSVEETAALVEALRKALPRAGEIA